ncbi:MAG: sugar transferase [Flavobacterium sp.]|nr:sugar transferase [Flavobacterium sp.]
MNYYTVKRLFDIILSIILLICLSPIFLIIAFIIRIQDGGPSIFRQERIGKKGVVFRFYKFRSMPLSTPSVESKETKKLQITPFGKFIRRTNLDELPQFYNVLRGDMSFIGPRPPIPSQTELIEMRRMNGALQLSPGLSGWAQVNSFDGMSVSDKAKFDGEYAIKISFGFEFLILLKTILYFTKKPPTY